MACLQESMRCCACMDCVEYNNIALHGVLLNGLQESMLCLNNIALHEVMLNGLQGSMSFLNNIALHGFLLNGL